MTKKVFEIGDRVTLSVLNANKRVVINDIAIVTEIIIDRTGQRGIMVRVKWDESQRVLTYRPESLCLIMPRHVQEWKRRLSS